MHIVTITDKDRFIKQANDKNATVEVVRIVSSIPVANGENKFSLASCVVFHYRFKFEHGEFDVTNEWCFRETIMANNQDEVSKVSTMMRRMKKCEVMMTAGSI